MIKIQTSVKGIPYIVDVLSAIQKSRANIHTIDTSDTECVVVGENVAPLSFYLMQHSFHIGPSNKHMFIEIKKDNK